MESTMQIFESIKALPLKEQIILELMLNELLMGYLVAGERLVFEEIPMSEVFVLGVESMREEWETPENRVWNSLVNENE